MSQVLHNIGARWMAIYLQANRVRISDISAGVWVVHITRATDAAGRASPMLSKQQLKVAAGQMRDVAAGNTLRWSE
jgi:hypothetical protein